MNTTIKMKQHLKFYSIIRDILKDKTVQEMKNYRQHFDCDTFKHCFYVSYMSYKICKKLNLDYKSTARACMLHDLFLYDWRGRT